MAAERLHQQRDASLGLDDSIEHDVIQVRSMIAAVAAGHVHDVRVGLLSPVVPPIDVDAGTVQMSQG
jgi:hypothetical protein